MIIRSIYNEYDMGGVRKLSVVEENKKVEIAKIDEEFQVEKIEQFELTEVIRDGEEISLIFKKKAPQMKKTEFSKIKERAKKALELARKLKGTEGFMESFFSQFLQKIGHLVAYHGEKKVKDDLEKIIEGIDKKARIKYGTSCPQISLGGKIIEF